MSEKTVFISYRRGGTGDYFARSVEGALTRRGYDVFLDVDCIDAGQWAEQILTQVRSGRTLRSLEGRRIGAESAQSDLDEAWEIAERGPMKLFMADIHLHRARLFFRKAQYPWGSPAADLAAARELIEKCGYGRRKEELADAEAAVQNRGQG